MLLVNTRTSGSATSASINEVDPRGGAAVTGENSVGKTTALELFPLFFGALPSQITETVGGREPMLKFVLPMPQSAIVFEYQRGNDEAHDVHCAVLRRTDSDHRPVFRLVKGPFREEAFTRLNEGGENTFCDDRQMAQAFEDMGVQVSQLLDIADYRAVILGHEARTQDAKKLRILSTVYGFGSRLTNLDRLIAAVAKEKVDFKDFVRLAITIVQERLSSHGDSPSRHRVTLRQSKEQIQRWLRDRQALEMAFGMADEVELLRNAGREHTQAEADLRAARQAIAPALLLRRDRLTESNRQLSRKQSERSDHENTANLRTQQLGEAATTAGRLLRDSNLAITNEEARRASLSLHEVQAWSAAVEKIPQLQNDHAAAKAQIEIVSGQAGEISARYATLIHNAELVATNAAADLRAGKEDARSRSTAEAARLNQVHDQRVLEAENEFNSKSDEISPRLTEAIESKANLRAQIASAQASAASQQALDLARKAVSGAQDDKSTAVFKAGEAALKGQVATSAFAEAEAAAAKAADKVVECERALAAAQAMLTPADGSLLSALRESPNLEWKSTLAKIIDPTLLGRSDLAATYIADDANDTAYGWRLNTQGLETAAWTDDQLLRDALIQAQNTVAAAREKSEAAQVAMSSAGKSAQALAEANTNAQAEARAADSKLEARKHALAAALSTCDLEIKALKADGQRQLDALERESGELSTQLNNLQTAHRAALSTLRQGLRAALGENDRKLNEELADIEKAAVAAVAAGQVEVTRLRQEMEADQRRAGVDPDRLRELNKRVHDLYQEMVTAENRRPTVDLWRAWLGEGGDQILASLIERRRLAFNENDRANNELSTHNAEVRRKQDEFTAEVDRLEKFSKQLGQEVQELAELLSSLGLPEFSTRQVDPEQSVEDIKADLHRAQTLLENCQEKVSRRYLHVRDALTGSTSAVAEFIQTHLAALAEGASRIRAAEEICLLHKELGRQVLPNVINEASVILQQVQQFRSTITRFEAEIKRFNNEFQRGLSVAHFKRIHDFKVAIVSNFSDLDLMKEVNEIERVGREHEAKIRIGDGDKLPDARTAGALTKFLALLRSDSTVELDLASHVVLRGSVEINGETRHFSREADLEHISSNGINAIVLITLLVGMLNMIRKDADLFIPWTSDEVLKFDSGNFKGLMDTLRENRIDPVTASPKLTPADFRHFQKCYVFRDRGSIGLFAPAQRRRTRAPLTNEGAGHEA